MAHIKPLPKRCGERARATHKRHLTLGYSPHAVWCRMLSTMYPRSKALKTSPSSNIHCRVAAVQGENWIDPERKGSRVSKRQEEEFIKRHGTMLAAAATPARSAAGRRPVVGALLVRLKSAAAAPAAAAKDETPASASSNVKNFKIYRWDPNEKVFLGFGTRKRWSQSDYGSGHLDRVLFCILASYKYCVRFLKYNG